MGCYVKSKCYSDSDCQSPKICRDGKCVLECSVDSDCDSLFGIQYVCQNNHCVFPAECSRCEFENASSSCIHGVCTMGDCKEGYWNINGKQEDGCEYECSTSNGSIEACDSKDNDCDGKIDDDFDLMNDVSNCGECGKICTAGEHAQPVCSSGRCTFNCVPGWFDNNHDPSDGCESPECIPHDEICDGKDNNCDCPGDTNGDTIICGPDDEGVDEGFDKTKPETCGPYCVKCEFPHGESLCISGSCKLGDCDENYWNLNGIESDGCEYPCTYSGDEICDSKDNDCDGSVDEGDVCGGPCPSDMAQISSTTCMDKYEASRPDATATSQGSDSSMAMSRPGVLPWMVNPMNSTHLSEFQSACIAAGKRICTKEEFFSACTGSSGFTYVFGNTFDREKCNCVDTFCDDYCASNAIPPGSCNTSENCGYVYNCFHVVPTGSFPECVNEYGIYDINGNVWEIVPSSSDPRGYEVRGGAFNCASPSVRLQCTFNAGWNDLFAGFRCCKDIP